MALNKKSCSRIAAVVVEAVGPVATQTFLARVTKAADTDNKSFRKTMRRIAKAAKKQSSPAKPKRVLRQNSVRAKSAA